MSERFLSLTEVAQRLGVTTGGLLNLRLPEPDALIGRTRGWKPETIDRWNAARPGHAGKPKRVRKKGIMTIECVSCHHPIDPHGPGNRISEDTMDVPVDGGDQTISVSQGTYLYYTCPNCGFLGKALL